MSASEILANCRDFEWSTSLEKSNKVFSKDEIMKWGHTIRNATPFSLKGSCEIQRLTKARHIVEILRFS